MTSTPELQTEIEAAAFRKLIAHLRAHPEVQNIDLMILADFCRNCLAKWLVEASVERGIELSDADARERVYGESYDTWKRKHHRPATPEQLEALARRGIGTAVKSG